MATNPQSYLPPASQPWGRFIDKKITDIENTQEINSRNINNNLKQLNSNVNVLSIQQNTLQSQQNTLQSQQTQLNSQQSALANQQNALYYQQGLLSSQQSQLSSQQSYLETFQTYTTSQGSTVSTSTTSTTELLNLSLSFNLSRYTRLLVDFSCYAAADSSQNASGPSPSVLFFGYMSTDSNSYNQYFLGQYGTGGILYNYNGTWKTTWNGGPGGSRIIELQPGYHTINTKWFSSLYGGIVNGSISYGILSATVVG